MMLSFSDDELQTVEMALRITLQMHLPPAKEGPVLNVMAGFIMFHVSRLIERIEQYNEDKENGDA